MKHIGTCLDNIQILLARMPKNIDSTTDKAKATQMVDEIEEYAHTLEQLITHPKLRVYLLKLSNAPIDGIKLQGGEVEKLLKDLEHMLYLLDLYIQELRDMIKNHSNTWRYKAKQIFIAVIQLLDRKKKRLGREYSIAQNIKSKIRRRLNEFGNKAERLSDEIDDRFGGVRGELRREFRIVLYKKHELKEIVDSEKHLAKFLK